MDARDPSHPHHRDSEWDAEHTHQRASDWHLNKTTTLSLIGSSVGLLVAMVSFGVSGIWVVADIKRDVEVVKVELKATHSMQHDRDERQDRVDQDTIQFLRGELATVNAKLDRLIDNHISDVKNGLRH